MNHAVCTSSIMNKLLSINQVNQIETKQLNETGYLQHFLRKVLVLQGFASRYPLSRIAVKVGLRVGGNMVGNISLTLAHNITCISVDTSNTVYIVHPTQYSSMNAQTLSSSTPLILNDGTTDSSGVCGKLGNSLIDKK